MADLITMLSAVAGQQGEEADEDFNQTVLLLHGDGTNGAQNNTFLDSSTNNFTITRNGNTTQGTFSPFSVGAGEWSNYFDGNGDFLSLTATSALQLENTTAFAIEFWVYPVSLPSVGGSHFIIRAYNMSSPFQGYGIAFGGNASNTNLQLWNGTAWADIGAVSTNTWTHIAVTYEGSGSTLRYFINGTQQGSATTVPASINWTGTSFILGARNSDFYFNGYLSNVRVVKGSAVYTSNFTPSTTPLTAITNTSLLTCQSNRFVDNSTNAFAITRNGDVKVTPFSPFAPTAAYSAGTNGGSGYFDGSGDTLTVPSSSQLEPGSGDFTIEMWLYPLALPGTAQILVQRANSSGYANFSVSYRSTGSIEAYMSLSNTANVPVIINAGSCPVGSWSHIVFTKSNLTYTLYINGTQVGTGTAGSHPPTGLTTVTDFSTSSFPINGYLAGVKIIKGSAVAPSGVPTTPPVDSSGTSLLLNFTNAGIIDNTGKNNLETVDNAQIDTGTKKYGTGSLEFDGSGDVLRISPNSEFIGAGNFTIEGWIRQTASSGYKFIYSATGGTDDWNKNSNGLGVYFNNGIFGITSNTLNLNAASAINLNQWYHIAVVRSGTSIKGYIDGVETLSGTSSESFGNASSTAAIGTQDFYFGPSSPRNIWQGFIDDLRITKGVARYTAAFTPPTKAFPDQ